MNMKFLVLILLCGGGLFNVQVRADDWLITPQEALFEAARQSDGVVFRGKNESVPGSPEIRRIKPDETGAIKSPFDIVFRFVPKDGAVVNPQSFRVLYGLFKMDITNRVAQHAQISSTGVTISRANIPSGKHRLVLNVTDNANRTGEAEFLIEVE